MAAEYLIKSDCGAPQSQSHTQPISVMSSNRGRDGWAGASGSQCNHGRHTRLGADVHRITKVLPTATKLFGAFHLIRTGRFETSLKVPD